jgi:hypothetical protein
MLAASLVLLLSACSSSDDEGDDAGDQTDGSVDDGTADDGQDDGAGACASPEYGDGTCQPDLDCDAPDIDCFTFLDSQAEAEAWFLEFEDLLAAQEFRDPRAVVPDTDPRFQRMRDLLDQGWSAYQDTNPVGDLSLHSPALVLIEDPSVNAFVIPDLDTGNAGFAVMVQTGLLDQNSSDQAMLGLVMHELEHAVALHIVADVKERLRTFYVADGGEPFGFEAPEDAAADEHGTAWRALAEEAGPFPHPELGGLPLGGGQLDQIFKTVVDGRTDDPACSGAMTLLGQVQNEIFSTFSPIDADLLIDDPSLPARVDEALIALRDECLFDFQDSFIDVVAEIAGATPDEIRGSLTPEDLKLVEGVHFIDAVADLTLDRRIRMNEVEEAFTAETGLPWDALRYFSYEEAADDATVPVLDALGVAADGLAEFLFEAQDVDTQGACAGFLDAGQVPPYGADLSDEHHATCWRVDHVEALAASGLVTDGLTASTTTRAAAARRRAPVRRAPRLIPPRLSDLIVY